MKVCFADEFEVSVEAFQATRTALGWMGGRRYLGSNLKTPHDAASYLEEMLGSHRTHVMERSSRREEPDNEQLPPWQLFVWLRCRRSVHGEADGSELVVVWFRHVIGGRSLQEIIQEDLGSLRWSEHARDFEN